MITVRGITITVSLIQTIHLSYCKRLTSQSSQLTIVITPYILNLQTQQDSAHTMLSKSSLFPKLLAAIKGALLEHLCNISMSKD